MQIGLISDTHSYLDPGVFKYFEECDEIWHAGDFGNIEIANLLTSQAGGDKGESGHTGKAKILRGVYGNIDGNDIRTEFPETLIFTCEQVKVFIKHIGGYPSRYAPGVKEIIIKEKPQLFISGHSHILKVMYDNKLHCLHMNPGAAGKHGWHKVRTLIRFVIDGKDIKQCEVIELGNRQEI